MTLAQRLYEAGHITYMRTDSFNVSDIALKAAGDYITKEFGDKYYTRRVYKTKSSGAQEAHEAIRPTRFTVEAAGHEDGQKRLYRLIWQRMVASQMSDAQIERTEIKIKLDKKPETFVTKGEILLYDGFLRVYGGGKDDVIVPTKDVKRRPEARTQRNVSYSNLR